MSNLKKVLALVLTLAMVLSFVIVGSAATFPDVVYGETDYADEIHLLLNIGALKGDENGNYNPDSSFTREMLVTMAYRLTNASDDTARYQGASKFVDVADDRWSNGAINWGYATSQVIGVDPTHFNPTGTVTVAEIATLMVRLLGQETADMRDNYPTAYMVKAQQLGLFDGVPAGIQSTTVATKALFAKIAKNTLFAESKNYGSSFLLQANGTVTTSYGTIANSVFKIQQEYVVVTGVPEAPMNATTINTKTKAQLSKIDVKSPSLGGANYNVPMVFDVGEELGKECIFLSFTCYYINKDNSYGRYDGGNNAGRSDASSATANIDLPTLTQADQVLYLEDSGFNKVVSSKASGVGFTPVVDTGLVDNDDGYRSYRVGSAWSLTNDYVTVGGVNYYIPDTYANKLADLQGQLLSDVYSTTVRSVGVAIQGVNNPHNVLGYYCYNWTVNERTALSATNLNNTENQEFDFGKRVPVMYDFIDANNDGVYESLRAVEYGTEKILYIDAKVVQFSESGVMDITAISIYDGAAVGDWVNITTIPGYNNANLNKCVVTKAEVLTGQSFEGNTGVTTATFNGVTRNISDTSGVNKDNATNFVNYVRQGTNGLVTSSVIAAIKLLSTDNVVVLNGVGEIHKINEIVNAAPSLNLMYAVSVANQYNVLASSGYNTAAAVAQITGWVKGESTLRTYNLAPDVAVYNLYGTSLLGTPSIGGTTTPANNGVYTLGAGWHWNAVNGAANVLSAMSGQVINYPNNTAWDGDYFTNGSLINTASDAYVATETMWLFTTNSLGEISKLIRVDDSNIATYAGMTIGSSSSAVNGYKPSDFQIADDSSEINYKYDSSTRIIYRPYGTEGIFSTYSTPVYNVADHTVFVYVAGPGATPKYYTGANMPSFVVINSLSSQENRDYDAVGADVYYSVNPAYSDLHNVATLVYVYGTQYATINDAERAGQGIVFTTGLTDYNTKVGYITKATVKFDATSGWYEFEMAIDGTTKTVKTAPTTLAAGSTTSSVEAKGYTDLGYYTVSRNASGEITALVPMSVSVHVNKTDIANNQLGSGQLTGYAGNMMTVQEANYTPGNQVAQRLRSGESYYSGLTAFDTAAAAYIKAFTDAVNAGITPAQTGVAIVPASIGSTAFLGAGYLNTPEIVFNAVNAVSTVASAKTALDAFKGYDSKFTNAIDALYSTMKELMTTTNGGYVSGTAVTGYKQTLEAFMLYAPAALGTAATVYAANAGGVGDFGYNSGIGIYDELYPSSYIVDDNCEFYYVYANAPVLGGLTFARSDAGAAYFTYDVDGVKLSSAVITKVDGVTTQAALAGAFMGNLANSGYYVAFDVDETSGKVTSIFIYRNTYMDAPLKANWYNPSLASVNYSFLIG